MKSAAAATAANASEPATRWLVGALVGKQVYLFDPTLGWPIPTREDKGQSPKIESAATLAEVLADDGLLRKLDVSADKPYPLHSADLKSCRVEIITSSCYWSPLHCDASRCSCQEIARRRFTRPWATWGAVRD